MAKKDDLYADDFFAWSREQAALLREGRLGEADIKDIAEEIDSMGRTEKRELVSRLTVLLLHLLKWRYQPEKRSASWEASIRAQRNRIEDHLDDNPSLRPFAGSSAEDGLSRRAAGGDRRDGFAGGGLSGRNTLGDPRNLGRRNLAGLRIHSRVASSSRRANTSGSLGNPALIHAACSRLRIAPTCRPGPMPRAKMSAPLNGSCGCGVSLTKR